MTQRVRDGLGLPAGFYRLQDDGPTFFLPNGITADHVESMVLANVTPVSSNRYDWVAYDRASDVFVPTGNPQSSPTHWNAEAVAVLDDILRAIFGAVHPIEDFPYSLETSQTRANIVDDLATLKADFVLDPT